MRHARAVLALVALASAAAAQAPTKPRAYLPQHYHIDGFVDLEALRDSGFMDAVERSMAYRTVRSLLRQNVGVDPEQLFHLHTAARFRSEAGEELDRVIVLRGTDRLRLPDVEPLEHGKLGALEARIEQGRVEVAWIQPAPGLLVVGPTDSLSRVVAGEQRGGVPLPDLLPLIAEPHTLAVVAAVRGEVDYDPWTAAGGFPQAALSDTDRLAAIQLRLGLIDGEQDEPRLEARFLARFEHGTDGPDRFEQWLRASLAEILREPVAEPLRRYVDKLVYERRDQDLTVRLDLGPPEQAGAELSSLGAFSSLWLFSTTVTAQPMPIVVEAPVPARPLPPDKNKAPR